MKNPKGYIVGPVVIGLVCLAVGVAVGVGGTLYFMGKQQGGLGDGTDIGIVQEETGESIPAEKFDPEDFTAPETELPTPAVTENLSYLRITVSGSDYVYKGEVYSLDGVLAIIRTNPDLPLLITNDRASKRAYEQLVGALEEGGVSYTRE